MDSREPLMLIEAYQLIYKPQEDDLFEEIVDYLLDEGYVDDVDSALDLIEELSDEEIVGILDEGRSEEIRSKMQARYGKPEERDTLRQHVTRKKYENAESPNTGPSNKLTKGQMMYKAHHSAAAMRGQKLNASYEYDAYDVVLEHLISEGYVDSEDAALQMMSHMSEEWVEGILEANRPEREMIKKGALKPGRQVGRIRNLNRESGNTNWYGGDPRDRRTIQNPGRGAPWNKKQRGSQEFDAFYTRNRRREHELERAEAQARKTGDFSKANNLIAKKPQRTRFEKEQDERERQRPFSPY